MHPNIKRTALVLLFIATIGARVSAATGTQEPGPQATAQQPRIEIAFSPEAGGEKLVLKAIDSAQKEIRLAAYSFSSLTIAKALVSAQKRGIDVRVMVDDKRNHGKSSIAPLNLMVNAGIP
ncbi:phospholipase D-like domain-containing protein [Herbaspirillum autotrophicum]|uniref:phospholipase D-like domain-containing protein n=1 Tax=Herbaspirillum autotrophicum TaxID=180195 RepID=UPI00067A77CF|nr:phospholipase D-like domain-containing protein [Herbaspirillum autotrophicum]